MQYSIDVKSIGSGLSCVLIMNLPLSSHVGKLSNLSSSASVSTSVKRDNNNSSYPR